MLRILGCISVNGTKNNLEEFSLIARVMDASITQIGLKLKKPPMDYWIYSSPWYQFSHDMLDDEIQDFVIENSNFGIAVKKYHSELIYPLLTLCPTDMDEDEDFSCLLSQKTIENISNIGVGLQISPALVMPISPFWNVKRNFSEH